MKITNCCSTRAVPLHCVKQGDCVTFCHVFHQKHNAGDIFIVARVPGEYLSHKATRGPCKTLVVNLQNGEASLVDSEREVVSVPAEVRVGDEC